MRNGLGDKTVNHQAGNLEYLQLRWWLLRVSNLTVLLRARDAKPNIYSRTEFPIELAVKLKYDFQLCLLSKDWRWICAGMAGERWKRI